MIPVGKVDGSFLGQSLKLRNAQKGKMQTKRGTFVSRQCRKIFILNTELLVLLHYGAESKALLQSSS